MIDIARNIVPCSDKQDMKSRNGSYFQPSFSTRKRQRISSDLFSELPQKRSKTTNGRIWNKATYSFSSQILCTISSKVIRMWASFPIFASVPRAKRSNAAKPAQLPNRYRLPNFLLFKSYLPTDYKKTIVFVK